MNESNADAIRQQLAEIYRSESRQIFATLIRLLGDFDLAEEALHDAFASAAEQWIQLGVPANPRAWLVSTGRFKAIDVLRRRSRFDNSLKELARRLDDNKSGRADDPSDEIEDDRLRLIFTCCHPALPVTTQLALTLREICGLRTEEIAAAFLTSSATIAQRIVRGKAKIREAQIPYQIPSIADLPERLDSVLSVIYLVFNEGYSASSGDQLTRPDLSQEAVRLGRLVCELLPDTETMGLLALMLLHESRRATRTSENGELVLLEHQDRSLWNLDQIAEGKTLIEQAWASGRIGVYTIQAAIAAAHAEAPSTAATDWSQITGLYDLLLRIAPTPVVELNRAVSVAIGDSIAEGLELIDAILARGDLNDYHLAHAARADLCRRLGRYSGARASYERALSLARQAPECLFLQKRLAELD